MSEDALTALAVDEETYQALVRIQRAHGLASPHDAFN